MSNIFPLMNTAKIQKKIKMGSEPETDGIAKIEYRLIPRTASIPIIPYRTVPRNNIYIPYRIVTA